MNNFGTKKSQRPDVGSDDRGHQRASSEIPHDPSSLLGAGLGENVSGWVVAMVA
jgi:hypothetical protein